MMMTTHRRSASLSSSWPLVDDDDDDADVDIIAGRSLALLFREQSSSLLREQLSVAAVILCILIDPQSVVDDGRRVRIDRVQSS